MHGKFKEFTKDSEFTKENALKFGKEVSEKVAKRHKWFLFGKYAD